MILRDFLNGVKATGSRIWLENKILTNQNKLWRKTQCDLSFLKFHWRGSVTECRSLMIFQTYRDYEEGKSLNLIEELKPQVEKQDQLE